MAQQNNLTLDIESLVELTPDEIEAVNGGKGSGLRCGIVIATLISVLLSATAASQTEVTTTVTAL